ncbi:MAG: hypothetical protein U5K43_09175 [Halofilum sp. (in: g-proteobacteria)]|nr:hypothetical protein [Halofilum sp. (in: g-proteobacteria)]
MNRNTPQALLTAGVTLLTLAGMLIAFERVAATLAALDPLARAAALAPAEALVVTLALLAAVALWHAPRAPWRRLLAAAATGALAALLLALAAPHWLAGGGSPVALLR